MPKHLVIVESPTKAKTLKRFLGKDFVVESSVGHVRDLPANAAEVPAAYKKEPWARLGVNVEEDFKPLYVVQGSKKKKITELKKLCSEVDEILLATDEDREGEAISWHLVELLKPKVPVRRMVFHEITEMAVLEALDNTRDIDSDLVEAQETRRIIDRLYGYEVSPVLWRKIAPKLSAGRVQSVAIRMLVDRERARMRFHEAEYWDLVAEFSGATDADAAPDAVAPDTFSARLHSLDGRRIAGGKDFDPDTGKLVRDDVALLGAAEARELRERLESAPFEIVSAEEKPFTRSPAPPFTTSTLQQEGNRKLRFDAKRTMRAAQRLYENGYITYMRTDSVALSATAIEMTRSAIRESYGADFLPDDPRAYRNKVKNAQEAHEAIRPAGDRIAPPSEIRKKLGEDEAKIYDLVWKRTIASQMKDARGRRMTLRVGSADGGPEVVFQAGGNVIDFPGFLRAYVEGADDPEAALSERETILPPLKTGDRVEPRALQAEEHRTTPPARLTEATLVKTLEESGIGRPSTYASIIDTIQRREYTFKKGTALVPTFTAIAVVTLMERHLSDLIDPAFTARMEDRLDAISRGEDERLPYLREFYHGAANGAAAGNGQPAKRAKAPKKASKKASKMGSKAGEAPLGGQAAREADAAGEGRGNGRSAPLHGLRPLVNEHAADIDPRSVCSIPIGSDAEGREVIVRVGRYGPFLQRGDTTAPVPDQTCPDEMTVEAATALLEASAKGQEPIGQHPDSGEPVYVKTGRFGPYVQLGDGDGKKKKPKMVSLLKGMTPETVTLDEALALLALPRVVGQDEDGVDIVAHTGRYGPYIKRGSDTRSLAPEDDLLELSRERALELLAQEKRGRGFRKSPKQIKVFEKVEAEGGVDLKVLEGRYGPYVTDGKTNASLPKGQDPEQLSLADARDLLARRREKKGSKR